MRYPAHLLGHSDQPHLDRKAEALRPMSSLEAAVFMGALIVSGTIAVWVIWRVWEALG